MKKVKFLGYASMIALLTTGVSAQISTGAGALGTAFKANATTTNLNVGIGTNTPTTGLHLKNTKAYNDPSKIKPSFKIESLVSNTTNSVSNLSSTLEMNLTNIVFGESLINLGSADFRVWGSTGLTPDMQFNAGFNISQLLLKNGGDVCIGTYNAPTTIGGTDISAYKLFVKGGILTDEIRVRTGWADYVFDAAYSLKPLAEVETFIANNHHLPNVPSASQVEEEGISLGEMAKIQQEKIEELMLYIIEQNKRIEALEAKVGAAK